MADILNLNRARKRKHKADEQRQAAENRVRFGRSKAERAAAAERDAAAQRQLDSHHLRPDPD